MNRTDDLIIADVVLIKVVAERVALAPLEHLSPVDQAVALNALIISRAKIDDMIRWLHTGSIRDEQRKPAIAARQSTNAVTLAPESASAPHPSTLLLLRELAAAIVLDDHVEPVTRERARDVIHACLVAETAGRCLAHHDVPSREATETRCTLRAGHGCLHNREDGTQFSDGDARWEGAWVGDEVTV